MEDELEIKVFEKYFEQWIDRKKKYEMRIYGEKWNEKTCRVGKKAIIRCGSKGLSSVSGVISGFSVVEACDLPQSDQDTIKEIWGTIDLTMACIEINIEIEFY